MELPAPCSRDPPWRASIGAGTHSALCPGASPPGRTWKLIVDEFTIARIRCLEQRGVGGLVLETRESNGAAGCPLGQTGLVDRTGRTRQHAPCCLISLRSCRTGPRWTDSMTCMQRSRWRSTTAGARYKPFVSFAEIHHRKFEITSGNQGSRGIIAVILAPGLLTASYVWRGITGWTINPSTTWAAIHGRAPLRPQRPHGNSAVITRGSSPATRARSEVGVQRCAFIRQWY